MIDATNRKTNNTQNEVTEQLGGRVQDISYWKFEVERTIQDITSKCIHTVVAKKRKTTLLVKLLTKSFYVFWPRLYIMIRALSSLLI